MKRFLLVLTIILITVIFFWKFFINGLLPIPGDTIIGLYHPFRDLYAKEYPNGVPFKNFLITDSVRQQYLWRELAVSLMKKLELPLWNPYNFSGTPLLANLQSAPFYPLNILFFIFPFSFVWSILIFLQPLLAGIFMYCYLNNLRLSKVSCFIGGITFAFCGFFIAWLEWGTINHVALWLPLILLAIDKIFLSQMPSNSKLQYKIKNYILWSFIFVFSLTSSFFAGHLQTFFYLSILTTAYFFARWFQYGKIFIILFLFLILNILFLILTSIQWIPAIQFILLSARDVDQVNFNNPGWFIPWQHLIQFIVPDFFGNPTTLNYWGTWNYTELVGYVGIFPFVMAIYALFFRRDKRTLFFGIFFFLALIFALPTPIAKIPYSLNLQFFTTSQPTRLLIIIDFTLAILAALGLDYFFKYKLKSIFYPLGFVAAILVGVWILTYFDNQTHKLITLENISVLKRNHILPSTIFVVVGLILTFVAFFNRIAKHFTIIIYIIIVGVVIFDIFRFGWKFTPFTKQEYLFPNTKAISYLKKNLGNYRYMTTDSRILPPNFSTIYRLQSIDGYDPLYLQRYGELITSSERNRPDISPPFGFNRIITPHNYESRIIDLLGVKYILSLADLHSPKLKKVFQEGKTRVYENKNALPRTFFVESTHFIYNNKQEAIDSMFEKDFDFKTSAVVEGFDQNDPAKRFSSVWDPGGRAEIVEYSENKIVIKTKNKNPGFLVLMDSYYPTWKNKLSPNNTSYNTTIYRTNFNFRGIVVPSGDKTIEFYNSLF